MIIMMRIIVIVMIMVMAMMMMLGLYHLDHQLTSLLKTDDDVDDNDDD